MAWPSHWLIKKYYFWAVPVFLSGSTITISYCQCVHQGRIQEVANRGAQRVINFGALEQSWRMAPLTPTSVNLAPLKFSSLEPLWGAPACAWMAPYSPCWFIFFFFFPFFPSFFLSFFPFSFLFLLFLAPLRWPGGGRSPQSPPPPAGYAPVHTRNEL